MLKASSGKCRSPIRTILFITLSNIGDCVLTTPTLEALRLRYPQAHFDIVADPRSSELFNHCPQVRAIIHKHKNRGWHKLLWQLRREHYDLIVDLRTEGLAYLLRARRRLGKWGARAQGPHAVQQHFGVIIPLLGNVEPPPTHIWLDEDSRRFAAQALAKLSGSRWLAVGPGANWEPKIWPSEHFVELISQVYDEFDAVVLLGGPKDTQRTARVAADIDLPALDLSGRTNLLQATAILERMTAFIGNDSGLGHLASAVGIPTVTVFGPGQPERYHPWGSRSVWLVGPQGRLERLLAQEVAEQLLRLLMLPS